MCVQILAYIIFGLQIHTRIHDVHLFIDTYTYVYVCIIYAHTCTCTFVNMQHIDTHTHSLPSLGSLNTQNKNLEQAASERNQGPILCRAASRSPRPSQGSPWSWTPRPS